MAELSYYIWQKKKLSELYNDFTVGFRYKLFEFIKDLEARLFSINPVTICIKN